ncbi:MAG: hypothetical protein AABZ01_08555, partial [Gemmatimonadota bacterium]
MIRNVMAGLGMLVAASGPLQAQNGSPLWQRLSMGGVGRAATQIDSVFIDRTSVSTAVTGGDWVSYLAARLGALPIPDSMGIRVA